MSRDSHHIISDLDTPSTTDSYITFKDIKRLDEPAEKIAFAMARRFYWFHTTNPEAVSRFIHDDQGKKLDASGAAYRAYRYYYQALALELHHPDKNWEQLESRIIEASNTDHSLNNVLASPNALPSNSLTPLKHAHQVMLYNDQLAKQAAYTAYQQKMRYGFNEDQDHDDVQHLREKLKKQKERQDKANAFAFEVYKDFQATLHKDQIPTSELTDQSSLSDDMKRRMHSENRNTQAVQSAWNAGYKLGTVIAYCASLLPYVYYKARYGRNEKAWQEKHLECEKTRASWTHNISRVVGTVFAAVSFVTLILPAMLISHKTKRPTLGQDDTAQELYRLYDHITDQKGKVKPQFEVFVEDLVGNIIKNYSNNALTRSHSSKILINLLNSGATATEKMQALIGYMTTNNTTRSAIRSAKQLLWSRDRRFGDTDKQLLHNQGKRLYCVIEQSLKEVSQPACAPVPNATSSHEHSLTQSIVSPLHASTPTI